MFYVDQTSDRPIYYMGDIWEDIFNDLHIPK